jgi:hypothetical protein
VRPSKITIWALADCAHRKYQFMEVNQQRRAAGLKDKMPDIQKTLDTVRFLKTRTVSALLCAGWKENADWYSQPGSDPIEATFELNDTLYAKAHVPPTDEVYLWLGVCSILLALS